MTAKTPKNPAAVALGKLTSPRKAESSRQNGKFGGKPTDLTILAEVLDDYLRLVGPDPDRTRRIDIAWKFLKELVPAKDLPPKD